MSTDSTPTFERLRNDELRSRLVGIRSAARGVLRTDLTRHFTDHSVTHSDRLTELVDQLIAPIQSGNNRLKAGELFVLYASCYLHDIGMYYDRAGDTETIARALAEVGGEGRSADRVGPMVWGDLRSETQVDLLRRYHHLVGREMVMSSVNSAEPPIGLQLVHGDRPEYVACLCESHGLDLDADQGRERYAEITRQRAGLRVELLAALLRIADILDESQRRANPMERRSLALGLKSQVHWYRHHYTEAVTCEEANRTITIWFDFSYENHALYSPIIPKLQTPYIEAELSRHTQVLNQYSLGWSLVWSTEPKAGSATDPIPDAVLDAMRKEVDARAGVPVQESISAAGLFAEKYAGVKERVAELRPRRDSMPAADHLRELGAIAADLWRAGGSRSAWNLLDLPFEQGKASLQPGERLEMGCLLARTMENDQPGWACQILMGLTPIADHLGADDPQKQAYWYLRAKCMFNAYLDEYPEAARHALVLTTCAAARQEQWSSLSEWYLLQGRLDEAMDVVREVQQAGEEPPIRAVLVECRIRALHGDMAGAEDVLRKAANSVEAIPDRISLAMLHAELLHLSFRDEEAAGILRESVALISGRIAEERALAVADNQAMVSLHLLEASSSHEFYALTDMRRLAGVELWDTSAVIRAQGAAERGEHYEALPVFWRLIASTYRLGCWRSHQWASDLMARECVEIASMRPEPHWVSEAVFHVLASRNEKLADLVGRRLMEWGDARRIAAAVASCIQYGNLSRHAELAARILSEIADAIPDEQVAPVVDWLLARCPASVDLARGTGGVFSSIWHAVAHMGCRLTPALAQKVVSAAIGHEEWTRKMPFREALIQAATACLPALSPEDLPPLVAHITPLATEGRLHFDHDYADVVNLLCQLARLAGPQVRDAIAARLYPAGGGPANTILVQAAPLFGRELREDDRVCEWAREIATQIRLQVQRVAPGQHPQEVGGSPGAVARRGSGGTVQVSIGGHLQGLRALMQYRHMLRPGELREVVSAILDVASDPANILANRESLLYGLAGFADCLPDDLAGIVFSRLSAIARGAVTVEGVAATDAGDPLNPFKMKMGTADDVRGMGLYVLSCIVKARPNEHRLNQMNELLAHALTASSNQVRRAGAVAARMVPPLYPSVFYDLLLATRDHDPKVAASAMYAFAGEGGLQLDEGQFHSLAYSILMAAKSSDRELRRAAAHALSRSEGLPSSCVG
ncbi:MAG TPA: hypothetical protein VM537_23320, partial [Anaerolineae bacterium]|nr:hypothetical protein [Anaerolineae bacterium]